MFFGSCGKQEVLPMAKRKNKKITVKRNRLKGNTATANRKYKDTVFRMLFSDRKNLLSLYNAINETSYTDAAQLEICSTSPVNIRNWWIGNLCIHQQD